MECNGLKVKELEIIDFVVIGMICYYICEVGVWSLECEVFKVCCKVVKDILLMKSKDKVVVN